MPCSDITETIRLELDAADRLASYGLIKRTCGRAVGERSLLADALVGRTAPAILAMDADSFCAAHPTDSVEEEFLALKHLFAVQGALRALLGIDPGGANDVVSVGAVAFEGDITTFEADIAVDALVEQIKSCGKCKGCAAFAVAKGAGATSSAPH